jgi:4-hydroxybenzoate polyprenyltransferase
MPETDAAPRQLLPPLLAAMRPKQWIKNLLLFAGMGFSVNQAWRLGDDRMWDLLARATAAFGLFCATASAIYLINDVLDVAKDRGHPVKRHRPVASGRLAPATAVGVAMVLMPVAVALGFLLAWQFGAVLAGYAAMQLLYVLLLKHVVLVDVFVIALGFVGRAVAGALVVGVAISPWLYIVTLLGALFLGLCKRRHELVLLAEDAGSHRKNLDDYSEGLLDSLISIAASATVMAYSLYTFSSERLPRNHLMMLTVPFVIFGLFRYLYLAHRRGGGGSPEELLLRDRPLAITILLWILTAGLILGLSPR